MFRPIRLDLLNLEDRTTPTTFTVTSIADAGAGSLRQAILDANATAGIDDITFNISGGGVHTIQLASQLPLLQGSVKVDGYTQPGSSPNTVSVGNNAVIQVEVLGGGGAAWAFSQQSGFDISNSTFRGLALGNFGAAAIAIGAANNVHITGNFIGLRPDGVTARPNGDGIAIESGSGHQIGSNSPADRNVISGNTGNGISFSANGMSIFGNYIGTTAAGTSKLGNGAVGVVFQSSNNFIGGSGTGMGNVISGNGTSGIWGRVTNGTSLVGNRIGTNANGSAALGNGQDGILISSGSGNTIGGAGPESRNVVSGNGRNGITLDQTGANTITGNYVGTNASGTASIPNIGFGISSSGPVAIMGQALDSGNLVSGNLAGGMALSGTFTVGFNRIGTDATGTNPLPNGGPGVIVVLFQGGTLGGTAGSNTIAFNTGAGVAIQYPALHYRVNGNSIHDNGGLGIDLIGDANDMQQAPKLTSTPVVGSNVTVTGNLAGPAGNYRIEFFANAAGGDEGQVYLGFANVTVGTGGPAMFSPLLNTPSGGLTSITATATRESVGSTSEFSAPILLGTIPNSPPTISSIVDIFLPPGTTSAPIMFQVSDAESQSEQLVVTAVSSIGSVVPQSGIVLGGSGASRIVTISTSSFLGKATFSTFTLTVTDPNGGTSSTSFRVTEREVPGGESPGGGSDPLPGGNSKMRPDSGSDVGPVGTNVAPGNSILVGKQKYAIGSDRGGSPEVQFRDQNGNLIFSKRVFDPSFAGGVRTVVGDVNGDGFPDIIAAAGPGGTPTVVIIDGKSGEEISRFDAFESTFTGGLFVTTADFDRDGYDDIVITPDEGGGPRVMVRSGKDNHTMVDFYGIDDPNFRGGCRAAAADVNGDGTPDLIVAAGFGGGPRLAGFDGTSIAAGKPVAAFADFFVFEQTLRNEVYVTAGDLDADGYADVIAGGGPGGAPRVLALSGKRVVANAYEPLANFFAGDLNSRGGVRLAVKNLDNDAQADLVTASGTGDGSSIRRYTGKGIVSVELPTPESIDEAFPEFPGGVFVG